MDNFAKSFLFGIFVSLLSMVLLSVFLYSVFLYIVWGEKIDSIHTKVWYIEKELKNYSFTCEQ
jgi:hypothetical protein